MGSKGLTAKALTGAVADPEQRARGTRAHRDTSEKIAAMGATYLKKAAPTFAAAMELYTKELAGEYGAADQVRLSAILNLETVRRRIIRQLRVHGVLIEVKVKDKEGNEHTTMRDNPLLFHLIRIHETLGYTAKDMLFSKKARGESMKDSASAALDMERRQRLRSARPLGLPALGEQRAIDIKPEPSRKPS
jgi:hypothetical protein